MEVNFINCFCSSNLPQQKGFQSYNFMNIFATKLYLIQVSLMKDIFKTLKAI